jgi:tetratricopeptide (TPR) repeat protein/transglutaminase-like putative cysteine protease
MRIAWFVPALCFGLPAFANDKPDIGPIPVWVKPVALPPADNKAQDQPLVILLSDEQTDLSPGRETVYNETAVKIQNPQGLAAGSISLPWRPDTDTLTVHKLVIRRGDKVIDVLASGQTFTVMRRETNLDMATLDGVLTANIQPEGLQVGDILDMAFSISTRDPVLRGHVEAIAGGWGPIPIGRVHLRAQWPSDLPIRLRTTTAFPATKPTKNGAITSFEYSADDVKPVEPPKGAPARYRLLRAVELTDFASWGDLAALLAPLYEKASVLSAAGPLQQEVARIRALSNDQKIQTEAALALVQDRVRYVALAMGTGGLVPADADTTWSRRFGDCKAKTAMLLAILHALGIKAEPVAANALSGDGIDARLPMIGLFNHVLVRATIGGQTYWLDGTRSGDTSLDRLKVPGFDWGLPLVVGKGAALTRMVPPPLDKPSMAVSIRIDARNGVTLPAPTHIEMTLRGDAAVLSNQSLSTLATDVRDRNLRDYWRKSYDFIEVKSTKVTFDPKTSEQVLSMDGMATMDWSSGTYETDGTALGYKADFTRDPGPNSDAPFAVDYPFFTRTTETILLPPGFEGSRAGATSDVDQTIAGVEYKRRSTLADNAFTVEASARSIAPEFPVKDAPAAQTALRELADRGVSIRYPPGYRPTDGELDASLATTPKTAAAYVTRGNTLLDRGRLDEAIKDFTAALALDPRNAVALADRGMVRVWKNDEAGAEKDLSSAAEIDPRSAIVFRARGLAADRAGKPRDAIAAYTTSLDIDPGNGFALVRRAAAYRAAGDNESALKDAAAVLKVNPTMIDAYLLRANIYRTMGKKDEAVAEAAAVSSTNPNNAYAQTMAASIYAAFRMDAQAMKAYDRAIAIKPAPYIYLSRSEHRPKSDAAGRLADIDAALKLEPGSMEALGAKARLQRETGDFAGAIASDNAVLAKQPDSTYWLIERGIAFAKKGDLQAANKDFDLARSKAGGADEFNNMCWEKATAGVALESALRDCDAALAKEPGNAAIMDSRGFVLLRLGRYDEAITAYDAALAKSPRLSPSLFGRGVAFAHKGDKTKAAADFAEAAKVDADAKSRFEGYGVTVPQ